MATGTTVTSTLRQATCWTLSSMRTPAQALARPPRGPWAQAPTAVELQLVGHPTAEHPRAGIQPVGHPAAEQVDYSILLMYWDQVIFTSYPGVKEQEKLSLC